jgi:hypothetical protein
VPQRSGTYPSTVSSTPAANSGVNQAAYTSPTGSP